MAVVHVSPKTVRKRKALRTFRALMRPRLLVACLYVLLQVAALGAAVGALVTRKVAHSVVHRPHVFPKRTGVGEDATALAACVGRRDGLGG